MKSLRVWARLTGLYTAPRMRYNKFSITVKQNAGNAPASPRNAQGVFAPAKPGVTKGGKPMKTALVTGGGRGIGKAICRELSREGFFVIVHYNSSEEEARALCRELSAAVAVKADLSQSNGAQVLFDAVCELGVSPPSVLVNNAGVSCQKLFCDTQSTEIEKLYNVNLKAPIELSRFILPDMIIKKQGRIINISSMWGEVGASCEVAYSAVKAGLIGFTKALAKEIGPCGITVNCITPGVIMTDMCRSFDESTLEALREETPLMRLGTPEDVASAVTFFASGNSAFITGQTLGVNGGFI